MTKTSYRKPTDNHPLIIPVFIMNSGCPHRCVFCNQKISAGNFPEKITREYFDRTVTSYLEWNKDKTRRVEIAFYGGSFTGIDSGDQEALLAMADAFIQRGLVHSIRISTRPDYIFEKQLSMLKKYNVATVEIGAESFVDDVLRYAGRGHCAADTEKAVMMLKKYGFKTGLHLMAGLPGDTAEGFDYSLDRTIELSPDTARIHPVLVFAGTALAEEFLDLACAQVVIHGVGRQSPSIRELQSQKSTSWAIRPCWLKLSRTSSRTAGRSRPSRSGHSMSASPSTASSSPSSLASPGCSSL